MFRVALGLVLVAAAGGAARANPAAVVPTVGTAVVGVDYSFENDSADVHREVLDGADASAPVGQKKDLVSHLSTHKVTPRLDVGFARDTWFSVWLPVTLGQTHTLDFDTGVDEGSSSTFVDGILPAGGFNSNGGGVAPPQAFKGISRHGLDQVWFGIGTAPMNQRRDDTKPTWKLGIDLGIAVGKIEALTPETASSDTGVSRGVDEMHAWTSFDKHIGRLEPWMRLDYTIPFVQRSNSLFVDPGFGSSNVLTGQSGGATFGVEVAAYEDKKDRNYVGVELSSRVIGHFEGRDYTEMWEAFAVGGDAKTGGPLVLDSDPTTTGVQKENHPGVSNVENYLELGATLAVRASLGSRVRFALLGSMAYKTDHAISFADAGVDLPTCKDGQSTNCETDSNELVNPGTREVNPLHVNQIDLVGHRYISTHNLGLTLGVQFEGTF